MIFSASDKKHVAIILQKEVTFSQGKISPITWTPTKSVDCIFYYTGERHFIMDNTFRTDVGATMLCSSKDVKDSDMPPECRLTIYKKRNYISGTANGAQIAGVNILNCVFSDSLFPIKKGDIMYIGSSYYVITGTTKNLAGNTTSLNFIGALKANILDKGIINIYPTMGTFMTVYANDIEGLGEVTKTDLKRTDL